MSESDENEIEQIIRNISPEDALELLKDMQDAPDFIILDVRTPKEFESGHIEGALNIDFRDENFASKMDEGDKEKKYMICCGSGVRSSKALTVMQELGYVEVYNILGGIRMWKVSGFPLTEE
ncbi:rhodanese-like domain-containing protein [Methanobacterium formicicum]|uniref:Rhodanese-like domain-containing protein n=1 Tax=Methanobacterium formicicum TaxID=2162 RepID=A0A843AJV2_METFO|nr:rhodanese-like domain-containing protein [Methanobacterium formicicum]MBF4475119.1 rhodanese-like domain-containing protein [Methanobacterium formicicum]